MGKHLCAALPDDLSLHPSTHVQADHNHLQLQVQGLQLSFPATAGPCAHRHRPQTCNLESKTFWKKKKRMLHHSTLEELSWAFSQLLISVYFYFALILMWYSYWTSTLGSLFFSHYLHCVSACVQYLWWQFQANFYHNFPACIVPLCPSACIFKQLGLMFLNVFFLCLYSIEDSWVYGLRIFVFLLFLKSGIF